MSFISGLTPSLRSSNATTPTAPGSSSPVAGGFQVTGIDLDKVKTASIKIRIPLTSGHYQLPTENEDAKLSVPYNTDVDIVVELKRRGEKLEIDKAQLEFTNDIRVFNPASALEPVRTGVDVFDHIGNGIKDLAADVLVSRAFMDPTGDVRVRGNVEMPWFMPDESLNRIVAKVDRDVSVASIQLPDFATLSDLLQRASDMTEEAVYEVSLITKETAIGIEGDGANLTSNKDSVGIYVTGTTEINPDGSIHIEVQDNDTPEIISGAGNVDISGSGNIEFLSKTDVIGTGELKFRTDLKNVTGRIEPAAGVVVPFNFTDPDTFSLSGSAGVSFSDGNMELNNGKFLTSFDNFISTDKLHISNGTGRLSNGRVHGSADGGFTSDGNHFTLSGLEASAELTGNDADISLDNYKLKIDGYLKAHLALRNTHVNSRTGRAAAIGRLGYELDPRMADSRNGVELGLFKRDVDFELKPNGTLRIEPGATGLAEFFAPFFKINGSTDQLVSTSGEPAGRVGSTELRNHIATLTNATISENNKVELLVDGVESYPKRMEMIKNAKESICLQTMIFKFDETGRETAQALVDAAQRGVKVRVIIDSLGNCENFEHLVNGRPLYKFLEEGGVDLALYNDPRESGLASLVDAVRLIPELTELTSPEQLKDPKTALKILNRIVQVAKGQTDAPEEVRSEVAGALNTILNISTGNAGPIELRTGDLFEEGQAVFVAKLLAEMNHRWHEKYLVVDGHQAILGGMNIADEYMFGGTDRMTSNLGIERPAWRDTDIFVEGGGAQEAYNSFAKNWQHMRGESLPEPPPCDEPIDGEGSKTTVQIIQHRPRIDGDHNITNFMLENLKALKAGEKAYIANAYFIPAGALNSYKQALMDAAQRGVDVRVVTNSATTTDAPQINQAAIYPYRELLKAGVRIFERSGLQCMHTKAASFGGNTSAIGSWNADNRSASLNSESLVVAYGENIGKQTEDMILADMAPALAKEIKLEDIDSLPYEEELENSVVSILSDLM